MDTYPNPPLFRGRERTDLAALLMTETALIDERQERQP
jgi:hypothetical protein